MSPMVSRVSPASPKLESKQPIVYWSGWNSYSWREHSGYIHPVRQSVRHGPSSAPAHHSWSEFLAPSSIGLARPPLKIVPPKAEGPCQLTDSYPRRNGRAWIFHHLYHQLPDTWVAEQYL